MQSRRAEPKTYTQVQFFRRIGCKNLRFDNGRPLSKTTTVDLTGHKLSNIPMISIIDDDELVRDAVKGLVRSLGYAAAEQASAEDYLRSNEHGTSSCPITDIQMPGMSGADLQAQLIGEGNFTPIIFMTAFDNENIRARVLEAGAFGYLKKPFDENDLVQCLENALKTH